jgi:hypothetical protein
MKDGILTIIMSAQLVKFVTLENGFPPSVHFVRTQSARPATVVLLVKSLPLLAMDNPQQMTTFALLHQPTIVLSPQTVKPPFVAEKVLYKWFNARHVMTAGLSTVMAAQLVKFATQVNGSPTSVWVIQTQSVRPAKVVLLVKSLPLLVMDNPQQITMFALLHQPTIALSPQTVKRFNARHVTMGGLSTVMAAQPVKFVILENGSLLSVKVIRTQTVLPAEVVLLVKSLPLLVMENPQQITTFALLHQPVALSPQTARLPFAMGKVLLERFNARHVTMGGILMAMSAQPVKFVILENGSLLSVKVIQTRIALPVESVERIKLS